MPGRFIKSEVTGPKGTVFEMQHRYEDRALIVDVIRQHRPAQAVELGTAKGGFAALLAVTLKAWGGRAYTVEKTPEAGVTAALSSEFDNVVSIHGDALTREDALLACYDVLARILKEPGSFLYCDNGNKPREIELYAPLLGPRALLGTHDYWTEVDPKWVEPFLADLGYVPHRHPEFEALAHPVNYPASLTRFWTRA
jgi:hypothetical protein